MKAWMGFYNTVYCKTAVLDDVLLRVWEYDPAARQAKPFKPGWETIRLSAGLPVVTQTAIRHRLHDLNGVHVPTAAEIEAAAKPAPVTAPAPAEPCRAIIVYQPPVGVSPVVVLGAPKVVVSLWHSAMVA